MPFARTTDPETSHEAAASVDAVSLTKRRILAILSSISEATDETIYAEFIKRHSARQASPSSIRSRRAELEKDGKIVFSDNWGKTVAGRRSRKWKAA